MIRGMSGKDLIQLENEVLECLSEHPIFASQIADKLQVTTGTVNDTILSLRSRGYPICGDDTYYGYYYGSERERKRTAEDLEAQMTLLILSIRFLKGEKENDDL